LTWTLSFRQMSIDVHLLALINAVGALYSVAYCASGLPQHPTNHRWSDPSACVRGPSRSLLSKPATCAPRSIVVIGTFTAVVGTSMAVIGTIIFLCSFRVIAIQGCVRDNETVCPLHGLRFSGACGARRWNATFFSGLWTSLSAWIRCVLTLYGGLQNISVSWIGSGQF